MYTRYEDFVTRTHRPAFRNEMKLGVNRDGTLQFGQFKVIANVGAQRAGAANGAWYHFQHTYNFPNLRLEAVDVMTNSYKSGPYRCVSHPNGTFALETLMDKAAYAINMDPVEFRLKNINTTGNLDTPTFRTPLSDVITGVRDSTLEGRSCTHRGQAGPARLYHGTDSRCTSAATSPSAPVEVMSSQRDGSVQAVSGSRTRLRPAHNMMMVAPKPSEYRSLIT